MPTRPFLKEPTASNDRGPLFPAGPQLPCSGTGKVPTLRDLDTAEGISPLAFPGRKDAVVKVNSYAHDEDGVTTEDAALVTRTTQKRRVKEADRRRSCGTSTRASVSWAQSDAATALLCWGSVRNACDEVAAQRGLRVIQPVVLSPFPDQNPTAACRGVMHLIAVEENATGHLLHSPGSTAWGLRQRSSNMMDAPSLLKNWPVGCRR